MLVNSPFLHILSLKKFNFFLWNLLYRCFAFFFFTLFFHRLNISFSYHRCFFRGTLRLYF
jgi:hypothetical protein